MANLNGFDANAVEPAKDFSPLPSGKYIAQITETDTKATAGNTGERLEVTYEILEGPHKGRKVWSNHTLTNENPAVPQDKRDEAVRIGQGQLSSICRATKVMRPRDSQEFHYKRMEIRVEYVRADGKKALKDRNEVRGWVALDDGIPFETTTTAPTGASSAGASPWKKQAA